jgi:hypothetical protein
METGGDIPHIAPACRYSKPGPPLNPAGGCCAITLEVKLMKVLPAPLNGKDIIGFNMKIDADYTD